MIKHIAIQVPLLPLFLTRDVKAFPLKPSLHLMWLSWTSWKPRRLEWRGPGSGINMNGTLSRAHHASFTKWWWISIRNMEIPAVRRRVWVGAFSPVLFFWFPFAMAGGGARSSFCSICLWELNYLKDELICILFCMACLVVRVVWAIWCADEK